MPFVSSTTNGPWLEAALQLPADPHDIEVSVPTAATSCACPQAPCLSLTTNPCEVLELSVYIPPAPQLPADAHDTEYRRAWPPVLRAAATSFALRQMQIGSLTTNACRPELFE